MSLIATGFLRSTSGARFLGSFMLKDSQYIVAGSFASSVPAFKSSAAILTYDKEESLSGTKAVDGVVGSDKVTLQFSNGSKIEGKLDFPISPAASVCGAGFFTQT
ncbi:hypothetical protein BDZ97DRAFT_1804456 [Flammula alnicola]|nr:hypothetical protein BDZ97DRAFT_1804456 [Flammula alnicola]